MGVLDTLMKATKARDHAVICLDTALDTEYRRLAEELVKVAPHDSFDRSKSRPIIEQMETVRERMVASEVKFTFEAIEWTRRVELDAEHPPRPDDDHDQMRGFNRETLPPILVRESCVQVEDLATGDVATDIPESYWEHLIGDIETRKGGQLNRQQFADLWVAASNANDITPAVPTSALSLLQTAGTGESSKSPAAGPARPRNGSKGGSRPGSRKSNATKKAVS